MIVVPVSREEDREQVQCGDIEAFDHEQGQQGAAFALSTHTAHEDQGSRHFIMFMSWISLLVCFPILNYCVGAVQIICIITLIRKIISVKQCEICISMLFGTMYYCKECHFAEYLTLISQTEVFLVLFY